MREGAGVEVADGVMQGQDNEKEDHRNRILGGKVQHYFLSVDAMKQPMRVREDQAGYNSDNSGGRDA